MQGALCQLIPLLHHSRWNWKHWKFICIAMNVFEAKPFCTHIDMWSAWNDYKNTIITFGNSWTIECESMAFSNCYYSTSSTSHSNWQYQKFAFFPHCIVSRKMILFMLLSRATAQQLSLPIQRMENPFDSFPLQTFVLCIVCRVCW